MLIALNDIEDTTESQKLIKELYEAYAYKLMAYTRRRYQVQEDHAMDLVYKTIYRIAGVYERYHFETEQKRNAFVFKTHLNHLRNYFRDNKSFESRHFRVEVQEYNNAPDAADTELTPKMKVLQQLLDKMEDWERILLLMRGQGIPYGEIAQFVNRPEKHLKVYYARLKKKLLDDMNELLNTKH